MHYFPRICITHCFFICFFIPLFVSLSVPLLSFSSFLVLLLRFLIIHLFFFIHDLHFPFITFYSVIHLVSLFAQFIRFLCLPFCFHSPFFFLFLICIFLSAVFLFSHSVHFSLLRVGIFVFLPFLYLLTILSFNFLF